MSGFFTEPWVLPALISLIVWGGTTFVPKIISLKIAVPHMSIYQGIFFFITSILALAVYHEIPSAPWSQALLGMFVGAIGTAGQYFYNLSAKKGPVSYVSIISSLYPLVATALAILFLHETLSVIQVMGVAMGIGAVLLLANKSTQAASAQNDPARSWLFPALGALVMWGVWAFLPKVMLINGMSPAQALFFEAIGNIIVILPIMIKTRMKIDYDGRSVLLMFMSTSLTTCAVFAYYYALKTGPVSIVGTMTALYPVVTVMLARTILKEPIKSRQVAALLLAILAVVLLVS